MYPEVISVTTWPEYWERVVEKIFRYLYLSRGMIEEIAPIQASLITSAVIAQMPVLRHIPCPECVSGEDFVKGFRLQEEGYLTEDANPEEITKFLMDLTFQRAGLAVADFYTVAMSERERRA